MMFQESQLLRRAKPLTCPLIVIVVGVIVLDIIINAIVVINVWPSTVIFHWRRRDGWIIDTFVLVSIISTWRRRR